MKLRHLFSALLLGALPLTAAHAFVDVSINIAPPVLPVFEQPPCPVEGYLWTPGYYGYGDEGYYWIPGVWCAPPRVGFLWTPGYWGYDEGFYAFHSGYWGPTVGFYGGVCYGYGYDGYGYRGGRWDGGRFRYNTYVTNVNKTVIRNVYVDRNAGPRQPSNRTSFNGPGGLRARPDARQLAAARGPRVAPTSTQVAKQGPSVRNGIAARRGNGTTPQRPRDGADRFLSPRQQDEANRQSQNVANERPVTARAGRDGLSPAERQVVDRRQARMDRRQAREGYGYDRSAPRANPYDARATRPGGGERRYTDPRGQGEQYGRQPQGQKAERRAQGDKREQRDERKRDKRDQNQ